jgi:2',3'-cyclic-nucleotide 2'-phosphodiesterase (5'-nucleotidase family)
VRILLTLTILALAACGDDDEPDYSAIELGEVTVPLETFWDDVRTREALAGNLIADAILECLPEAELVLFNGGAIRFDEQTRPDGVYPAGTFTEATLRELLRFDFMENPNSLVLITITGAQLDSALERSVASLVEANPGPDETDQAKGWFLHIAGGRYEAYLDRQAQVVSEDFSRVIIEGDRAFAFGPDEQAIAADASLRVATTNFVADGLDGHVGLAAGSNRTAAGKSSADCLRAYIVAHTPVTPVLDERIRIGAVTPPL